MINELLILIRLVEELLKRCGWTKEASWFETISTRIRASDPCSDEFDNCLEELDRSIAGMGSFTDLPLESIDGSQTKQELRNRQWDLAEQLGKAIEKIKKERKRTDGLGS